MSSTSTIKVASPWGVGLSLSPSQLTVNLPNDTITLNQAIGGAATPSVNDQTPSNGGEAYGGGLWSSGTALTMNQDSFTHNGALGADGPGGSLGVGGGAAGGAGGGGCLCRRLVSARPVS